MKYHATARFSTCWTAPTLKLASSPHRWPATLMSLSSQHLNTAGTQPSNDINIRSPQEKPKAGASWKAEEQHVLPFNRLGIVIPGLMACISLTTLDQVSIPATC
jgi:hypothetical protein